MENQRLGVAGGVIFYVTWIMVEFGIIEEALMEIEIPFYSHPETHKDPVGTALHIQEANMDDTTQTKTHRERAAASYMTTEKHAKRERDFQRYRFLYLTWKST
ncbi:hypothetical protein TNCV_2603981 [Trichonephila clavipes]|nr:hypothetical protein TNCV_2603981 [Trichonephila clavipes]